MALVDLKLPKKTKTELSKDCCVGCPSSDQDAYPWGFQLRFEKEQIDKMPEVKTFKVGDKVLITAEARVTEIRTTEKQSGKDSWTTEIQIEKIDCQSVKPLEKLSMKEYRQAREKK